MTGTQATVTHNRLPVHHRASDKFAHDAAHEAMLTGEGDRYVVMDAVMRLLSRERVGVDRFAELKRLGRVDCGLLAHALLAHIELRSVRRTGLALK